MGRWASERVHLLVGTRADEGAAVVGLAEEARAFAAERGWEFVQISAKADRRPKAALRTYVMANGFLFFKVDQPSKRQREFFGRVISHFFGAST